MHGRARFLKLLARNLKLCLLDSIGCGLFGAIQPCGSENAP